MKITHAMEAEFDGSVVRVMRLDNGMISLLFGERRQPVNVTPDEAQLLAKALPQFLENPKDYALEGDHEQ